MSKPFQFSMRRMFALVTLFCVELGLYFGLGKLPPERVREVSIDVLLMIVVVCTVVVGVAFRRPLVGFLWGLATAVIVQAIAVITDHGL